MRIRPLVVWFLGASAGSSFPATTAEAGFIMRTHWNSSVDAIGAAGVTARPLAQRH